MQYGRDHEERERHIRRSRASNTPPEEPVQPEEISRPGGSDVAPTRLAEARERERHRLEQQIGRIPGGEAGVVRGTRSGVSREALKEAAREADRRVVGHEVKDRTAD